MKLAILGAGAWGTAFALACAPRHDARLWTRREAHLEQMRRDRCNVRYLPDFPFPPRLALASSLEACLAGCDLAVLAVPVAGLRAALREVHRLGPGLPVLYLCKGFEATTASLPHEVAAQELPATTRRAVLSGPSFAREVARGAPAAVTLASARQAFAVELARELQAVRLRIYSTDDLMGVEVAGAVKNVVAIGAGICDGLELGDSARAALITRGLAEMTRLGVRLGGRTETFLGLAGAGDLILTCTGALSRNRRVGLRLATGESLPEILGALGHVAEGVSTAPEVSRIAARVGADMPIVDTICQVLQEGLAPALAVELLLAREAKAEHRP